MNQFEYLIPFVGIIYALSATDLLVSTHRLIIERENIKIHAVPIIWAIVAFVMIVNGWWGFFQVNNKIVLANAGQLFLLSLLPLALFLIASLSLPHKVKGELCMWQYFSQNKTPLYLCHSIYLLLIPIVLSQFGDDVNVTQTLRNIAFSAIFFGLIWLKHWAWHLIVGAIFLAGLIMSLFNQSINLS